MPRDAEVGARQGFATSGGPERAVSLARPKLQSDLAANAVQRSRPVILTALAAVLAFIPLTFSVFWGSMAYTLIGGTAVGTVLTLLFLPALYSIWFGVKA